jgi:hypothetical protein
LRTPPYPERLALEKPVVHLEFDLEAKLKKLCVKISLLQAIRDIPILTKTIRDLCIKKPRSKRKQPSTIQVGGQEEMLITNHLKIDKYANPKNPIVTTYINNIPIPNTLIDQGATINIMTVNTMKELQLNDLRSTQTILELVDRSKLKPEGIIDDVIVSLVSWEYPIDFMVIQPKLMEGHSMILGRSWLATTDAYISCRKGEIIISNGLSTKKIILHPPAQLASTNVLWVEELYEHNAIEQPIVNVEQTRKLQKQTEENIIDQFLSTDYYENLNDPNDLETFDQYHHIFSKGFHENYDLTQPLTSSVMTINE